MVFYSLFKEGNYVFELSGYVIYFECEYIGLVVTVFVKELAGHAGL